MVKKGVSKKNGKAQVAKDQQPMVVEQKMYEEKYQEVSHELTKEWTETLAKVDELEAHSDKYILEMLEVLKDAGYTRTAAVNKITKDHKHLRGFDRSTVYRHLPEEEKRRYRRYFTISQPECPSFIQIQPELSENPNVALTTFERESKTNRHELNPDYGSPELERQKKKVEELKSQLSTSEMKVEMMMISVKEERQKRNEVEQLNKRIEGALEQSRRIEKELKSKVNKPHARGKWDAIMEEGEIEIVVARELPDGSSLYRELIAAMIAKPVFYLKAIVGTNAKDFTAIQAVV
jgi:hypothetical protein